jgi:hypothetical protein
MLLLVFQVLKNPWSQTPGTIILPRYHPDYRKSPVSLQVPTNPGLI